MNPTRPDHQTTSRPPRPDITKASIVVEAPGSGDGNWAGAPSVCLVGGVYYLAYRIRRPEGQGRGLGNVVARSTDGVAFETLCVVEKDAFGAESLERPAITRTPWGKWQLYISCATPGSKHWWIDVLEADDPARFDPQRRREAFPGDVSTAVKDPVIQWHDGVAHAWITCHPLDVAGAEDRMTTRLATSRDTLEWKWHGEVLKPGGGGSWDQRGARITDVLFDTNQSTVYYDGRASADENFEERTGLAHGPAAGPFCQVDDQPYAQVTGAYGRGLRYLSVVPLPAGGHRLYFEACTPDGSHHLFTQLCE